MTDDERRAQLLDRWAELAPGEVAILEGGYAGGWCLFGNPDAIARDEEMVPEVQALILHHALTCAARRRWTPELRDSGKAPLKTWKALVATDSTPLPFVASAHTPDLAVLSAYVTALKAET